MPVSGLGLGIGLRLTQRSTQEDNSDSDSAIASNSSSTESLSSSILEYRKIHGRTYHGERHGEYWSVLVQTLPVE